VVSASSSSSSSSEVAQLQYTSKFGQQCCLIPTGYTHGIGVERCSCDVVWTAVPLNVLFRVANSSCGTPLPHQEDDGFGCGLRQQQKHPPCRGSVQL
jgi:hypothetical protein